MNLSYLPSTMHFLFNNDNLQICSSSSFYLVLVFIYEVSCFSGYILLQFQEQKCAFHPIQLECFKVDCRRGFLFIGHTNWTCCWSVMLRDLSIHERQNGFMPGFLNVLRRDIALWWKLCFLADYSLFPSKVYQKRVCAYICLMRWYLTFSSKLSSLGCQAEYVLSFLECNNFL